MSHSRWLYNGVEIGRGDPALVTVGLAAWRGNCPPDRILDFRMCHNCRQFQLLIKRATFLCYGTLHRQQQFLQVKQSPLPNCSKQTIYQHAQSSILPNPNIYLPALMVIPRTMVMMVLSVALMMMSMAGDASASKCTTGAPKCTRSDNTCMCFSRSNIKVVFSFAVS